MTRKTIKKCYHANDPIFTKNDFESSDGMMTSVWGPSLWHSMHTISFNYPVEPSKQDKENYMKFYKSIGDVLPCRYCRENFTKNIKKVPLTMETMKSRDSLSRWVYELHEEINKMLGKDSGLTFDDVRNRYEMFRSRCLTPLEEKKLKKQLKTKKREKGCVKPLYGVKSKCILKVVPRNSKVKSFNVSPKCILRK
tara:strand:+ start:268 stop:852 length:585 start_codon:yes stop_codon:yes gene_type:complete